MPCNSVDLDTVFDSNNFSSLVRLLHVSAIAFWLIKNLKEPFNGRTCDRNSTIHLSSSELQDYWICHVLAQSFTTKIQYFKKQSSAATPEQFGLFLDDEFILRCCGWINNLVLAFAERNPILLPPKHTYVNLLIADIHAKVKHNGVNDTFVALREKYWVIWGWQAVKHIVRACLICRKFDGPSYSPPEPPDLPAFRISLDPSFTHTGLDFAGPVCQKWYSYVFSRRRNQVIHMAFYLCLHSCNTFGAYSGFKCSDVPSHL